MKRIFAYISSFVLIGFNLVSCSNKTQDNKEPKMVGIYSTFFKLEEDNTIKPIKNINLGSSTEKEEFVYAYPVNTKDTYIVQIHPNIINSSRDVAFIGDNATIEQSDNYTFSYFEEFDITSYKFNFINKGTYRVNISIDNFSDKFDVIVDDLN